MIWIILTLVIFSLFIIYSYLNKKAKKDLIKLQEGYNENDNKSRRQGNFKRGEPIQSKRRIKSVSAESSHARDDKSQRDELFQTSDNNGNETDDKCDSESNNKLQGLLKRMKLNK